MRQFYRPSIKTYGRWSETSCSGRRTLTRNGKYTTPAGPDLSPREVVLIYPKSLSGENVPVKEFGHPPPLRV
ncbi:hypothetical protein E2C01_071735 [Portunus trituberculatus]|uniref:Uncharacterized protein n=1 Tax=Portunus trituberculatus TaxID=210409 RepID=A0A5B7I980_PORTR|nr:hypothetical protein [Portunus trituberculatus]